MKTRLVGLSALVGRTIKTVANIEVENDANCYIIILKKKRNDDTLEFIILQGYGCAKCYGGITVITRRNHIPNEVRTWIFDNFVDCEED